MPFQALIDPTTLPPFAALTPEAIAPALDLAIAGHAAAVAAATAPGAAGFDRIWLPLERAAAAIDALWSAVSHLHAVADTPALRAAYLAGRQRLTAYMTDASQNRPLYDALVALADAPAFAALPEADRAAIGHAIRDARLNGVALAPAESARFAELSVELASLSAAFGNAVLDATDAWSEHVTDAALLAGVPTADREAFAATAAERGLTGWVVTLQQPSISAVLTFAEDRALRERVYRASGTRASNQGPHAGRFDNSERIARIMAARREAAVLLGFDTPARTPCPPARRSTG